MAPRYGRGSRLWPAPPTVRACPRLHISFCVSSWWPLSQPRAGSFPSTPVRLHVTAVEREPPLHDPARVAAGVRAWTISYRSHTGRPPRTRGVAPTPLAAGVPPVSGPFGLGPTVGP